MFFKKVALTQQFKWLSIKNCLKKHFYRNSSEYIAWLKHIHEHTGNTAICKYLLDTQVPVFSVVILTTLSTVLAIHSCDGSSRKMMQVVSERWAFDEYKFELFQIFCYVKCWSSWDCEVVLPPHNLWGTCLFHRQE